MLVKACIIGLGLLSLVGCDGGTDNYYIDYPPVEPVVATPVEPVVPPVVQPIVPPVVPPEPIVIPDPTEQEMCVYACRVALDACISEALFHFKLAIAECDTQFPPSEFPRFREDNTVCHQNAELAYQHEVEVCYSVYDSYCIPQCEV